MCDIVGTDHVEFNTVGLPAAAAAKLANLVFVALWETSGAAGVLPVGVQALAEHLLAACVH